MPLTMPGENSPAKLLLIHSPWLLGILGAGLCLAQGPGAEIACEIVEQGPEIRRTAWGLSELVPTPGVTCTGGQPGERVQVDFGLAWDAPVANPLIGDGASTSAVVVVDSPDPLNAVEGRDYFPLQYDPALPIAMFVEGLAFDVHADGSPTRLTPFNVRLTTTGYAAGSPIRALFNVNGQLVREVPLEIGEAAGLPPFGFQVLGDGDSGDLRVLINETTSGVARPRFLAGGRPLSRFDDLFSLRGTAQTEWLARDRFGFGDVRYAAAAGSRVRFEVDALPTGVTPLFRASSLDEHNRLALAAVLGSDTRGLGGASAPLDVAGDAFVAFERQDSGRFVATLEANWFASPVVASTASSFSIPIRFACDESAGEISAADATLSVTHAPLAVAANPLLGQRKPAQSVLLPGPAYDPNVGASRGITFDPSACMAAPPRPAVSDGGVTNGASFLANPAAPGEIVSLFGTGLGPSAAAESIPLPAALEGTRVIINGEAVPLYFSSDEQLNVQLDFRLPEITPFVPVDLPPPGQLTPRSQQAAGSPSATVFVIRDGVIGPAVQIPLAAADPAIFTLDGGAGRAIAINPDSSLAQPDGSAPGVSTRPVQVGEPLIILATGLGLTNPLGVVGDDSYDEDGMFVRRDTVITPRVTIGGVEAELLFSGLSPQFPGVYQLNILVSELTPSGDAQPLVIDMAGAVSRQDVTIAVAAR